MTDSRTRMNKIVSKVLSLSPIAREIHDELYTTGYYKYAIHEKPLKDENPAVMVCNYNENGHPSDARLTLSINYPDADLLSAVAHELVHVAQSVEAIKRNSHIIGYPYSLTDVLARRLVEEAHAFTYQVEGPLLGFFGDLTIGKTENIADYKSILSSTYTSTYTQLYLGGLFDESSLVYSTDKMVDLAGYFYLNRFLPLSGNEKEKFFTKARKSVVSGFFQQELLKNNSTLDGYIADITMDYEGYNKNILSEKARVDKLSHDFGTIIGDTAFNPYNILKQDVKQQPVHRPATLAEVTSVTNTNRTFLSNQDWIEVLRADTPEKFIGNLFMGSQHKQLIMDVKNKYKR